MLPGNGAISKTILAAARLSPASERLGHAELRQTGTRRVTGRGWKRSRKSKCYLRRVSGECPGSLPRVSLVATIGVAKATGPPQRHLSPGGPAALNLVSKGRFEPSLAVWGQSGGGPVLVRGRFHVDRTRL